MAYIVFVAMVSAIYAINRYDVQRAFVNVWIPFLMLLPTAWYVNIPGLPDPNFSQAAVIPIIFVLVTRQLHTLELGKIEFLIFIYFTFRFAVDWQSRGYWDAQNYAFDLLTTMVAPYMMGRYIINSRQMDIATAKMLVLMFLVQAPGSIYELRMWQPPVYRVFGFLFPFDASGLSVRYGLARITGPFTHPILACVIFIALYRLHKWLDWMGVWKQPQTGLYGVFLGWSRRFPLSFSMHITIIFIVMIILTFSRGPWIGGMAGAALTAVGNAGNRKRALYIFVVLMVIGGMGAEAAFNYYLMPGSDGKISEGAETMLYRKIMLDRYEAFIWEKPWTGWGLTTVPQVQGMESIDNAYFLMALQHGIPAPVLFVIIFLYAIGTQIKFGLDSSAKEPPLGFTFAGIYLSCFFAFATVYIGGQTPALLFLFLGWGEGIRKRGVQSLGPDDAKPVAAPPPFRKVIY